MVKPPEGTHMLELTREKALELWEKLNSIPGLFDDFSVNKPQLFFQHLASPDSVWLERDDGNGILYLKGIIPGLSASGHVVYWDRKLRGREEFTLDVLRWLMTNVPLQKVNLYLPAYAPIVRSFAKRVGFKEEGRIRRWSYSNGKTFDIYIMGITREEAFANMEEEDGTIHGTISDSVQPGEPRVREPVHGLDQPASGDDEPGDADIGTGSEATTE